MRILTEHDNKYKYNTWDKVQVPQEYKTNAKLKIEKDNSNANKEYIITYEPWDEFYKKYNRSFFQERQWISKEYPELLVHTNKILELGCGTGSTLIPIIKERINSRNNYLQDSICTGLDESVENESTDTLLLKDRDISKCSNIFGVDYSLTAVNLLKEKVPQISSQFASADITQIEEVTISNQSIKSVDIVLLIYTLSAIHPSSHGSVFRLIHRALKESGVVIFKDYYEMDLTQLRFKEAQVLEKNFYMRGDNTYVYYFSREEIEKQVSGLFKIVKYVEDTKLIINRKKQKEMYRCFVEIKLERI